MPDERETILVQDVMSHYASQYRPTQIARAARPGFSGAQIWKLSTPSGSFALRNWPAEGLTVQRLMGLHRLLHHVRTQGVTQVAVPLRALNQSTLLEINDRLWQLEPWLPGEANYIAAPSREKRTAALIALAQWHQAAATFRADSQERRWFAVHESAASPAMIERLRLINSWTPRRLRETTAAVQGHTWREFREVALPTIAGFQHASPQIAGELQAASSIMFHIQPCLRDIWHEHVLFTGFTVTGLIDPSACRSESVAGDIARLLGSLLGDDRAAWDAALADYQTIRPLAVEELGAVELFDRSGVLLSNMTWIERILSGTIPVVDQSRVTQRMQSILTRLQNLCTSGFKTL